MPVTLASNVPTPGDIAVDGTSVYWAALVPVPDGPLTGAIMSVPLCGGTPATLAGATPAAIAIDTTSLYWTDLCGPDTMPCGGIGDVGLNDGRVLKMPLTGGAATTIASSQNAVGGIAVDGTSVYWTNTTAGNVATVMMAPLGGGTATTLASQVETGSMTLAAGFLAIDTANVYWVSPTGILQVPIGGAAPVSLAGSSATTVGGIAVDATRVYWTTTGGAVLACAIGGCGGSPTTLSSALGANYGIAVDATSVYWTTDGAILQVPVGGGPVTTLVSGQDATPAVAIAADATSLYWSDSTWLAGSVMKLSPK